MGKIMNKYNNPIEWLHDHTKDMKSYELKRLVFLLANKLDFDTLQDLFQNEMDKDGYFDLIELDN